MGYYEVGPDDKDPEQNTSVMYPGPEDSDPDNDSDDRPFFGREFLPGLG